jgi:hypothetical protein
MRYIGWLGCLGFALVGLYQQSVINSMEHNTVISAKLNEPIILQEGEKLIRVKASTDTKKEIVK